MTDMQRQRAPIPALRILALALALAAQPGLARDQAKPVHAAVFPMPAGGMIGVEDAYFSPDFWIARQHAPDQVLMDRATIDARNARLLREDDSMHDPVSYTHLDVYKRQPWDCYRAFHTWRRRTVCPSRSGRMPRYSPCRTG